jgi:hypothetical protein
VGAYWYSNCQGAEAEKLKTEEYNKQIDFLLQRTKRTRKASEESLSKIEYLAAAIQTVKHDRENRTEKQKLNQDDAGLANTPSQKLPQLPHKSAISLTPNNPSRQPRP